ncbi:DEAD/DEAH box helicase [Clostridium sp. BJN0001]|uniref:DEAD/DEAH box helicase n=1 Tax=Clostridium sp. BJN0001 TaxID=2930219 RepID=UPI001FD21DB0|nr:DEAD/DEAH box helicase [Clostridium sp. BJN0001]
MNENTFKDLGLNESILKAVTDLGFTKPSPIQEKSIPAALTGADLIGQAQTGTGKTAAYGCPILNNIKNYDNNGIKALIIAPTRELAVQVKEELGKLSKYEKVNTLAVYGGDSIERQIRSLKKGNIDIVVGTPGRLLDLIKRKCLHLEHIKHLVLDEADEMLNMGFIEDIESILIHTPQDRQTLLFSATMPDPIAKIAKKYMKADAETIKIKKKSLTVSKIKQSYFMVNNKHKFEALCRILDLDDPKCAIIFCRTKRGVDELVLQLQAKGYMVEGMHGDMTQTHRLATLDKFKKGALSILIATDVAARGIDVEDVTHVINYDLTQDVESYVHRIGRTGRADKDGIAYSLITPKDFSMLKQIQKYTKSEISQIPVPTAKEIAEKKSLKIISDVEEAVKKDEFSKFIPAASNLLEKYNPEDIIASLLKIKYDELNIFEYTSNKLDSPAASKNETRLFFSVGKRDRINPKMLIKFIIEKTSINSSLIGQIDLMDNFSFVSVDSKASEKILNKCPGKKLNNKKVNVEIANKKRK